MNEKAKLQRGGALSQLIGAAVGNVKAPDPTAIPPAVDVINVPAEKTRMNDLHRRMNETMQGSAIEELVESFKSVGQKQEVKGWRLLAPEADGTEIILIYGARRRAAASKLGVPLRVKLVGKPSSADLIKEMHAENRARKDYLPLEMAKELQAYLDSKEYSNISEMCGALGEDRTRATRLLGLLKLPKEVLGLYTDPTWMQLAAGSKLASVCADERAKERIIEAAKEWKNAGGKGNPTGKLLQAGATKPRGLVAKELKDSKGRAQGTIRGSLSAALPMTITLGKSASEAARKDLAKVLEKHFDVKLL